MSDSADIPMDAKVRIREYISRSGILPDSTVMAKELELDIDVVLDVMSSLLEGHTYDVMVRYDMGVSDYLCVRGHEIFESVMHDGLPYSEYAHHISDCPICSHEHYVSDDDTSEQLFDVGFSLLRAVEFMIEQHGSQKRDDGALYFTHPLAVARILDMNEETSDWCRVVAGLFHDLMEDTDTTYDDVVCIANKRVARAVVALTYVGPKGDDATMRAYYDGISEDAIARDVKIADRIHNLQSMKGCWTRKRQKRYVEKTVRYVVPISRGTVLQDLLDETISDCLSYLNNDE